MFVLSVKLFIKVESFKFYTFNFTTYSTFPPFFHSYVADPALQVGAQVRVTVVPPPIS